MATANKSPAEDDLQTGLIGRLPFQLRSLPARYRWEVTRRHPYYQLQWQLARDLFDQAEVEVGIQHLFRHFAVMSLVAIGVSGKPPNPSMEFDQLDSNDIKAGWLSGAVQPLSMRNLATLLVLALPKDTVGHVAAAIMEACQTDKAGDPPHKAQAVFRLATLNLPGLDSYIDEPLVSINPAASGRDVNDAMGKLLAELKAERSLPEQRSRLDKYTEYLRVWDIREGWADGAYNRSNERTLRSVAEESRESISTINNRYRSAFELIIGHPYSPELWHRTMGIIKLSELTGIDVGPVSRQRPLKSRSLRPVTETTLLSSNVDVTLGPASAVTDSSADQGFWELIRDIRSLIAQGTDDQAIAHELELADETIAAIPFLRARAADGL